MSAAYTPAFLAEHLDPPSQSNYAVTPAVLHKLRSSLWTWLLSAVPAAHLLPRSIAPSAEHALRELEACGWSLAEAQRRATKTLAEAARGDKGKGVEGRAAAPSSSQTAYDLGPEYAEERRGMPCGHVFKKGEAIYRCRDCALDDTCVQCAPCFNASNHEGHDIVFSVSASSGGCCDCGDPEAWTKSVCCRYHDVQSSADVDMSEAGPSSARTGDDTDMDSLSQAPGGWSSPKSAVPNTPAPEATLESLVERVPSDVLEGLTSFISILLTYVLDTLEHAPSDMKLPDGPEVLEVIKRMPCLEPQDSKVFCVVLWNDEKHSFKEVIDTVTDATEMTELQAKKVAERVDKHGREIIDVSPELRRLLVVARKLSVIDLAVTVRPAYDIFAEEVAHHVLAFLLDVANASLFVAPATDTSAVHPLDGLVPNAAAMRAIFARALLERWSHRQHIEQGMMASSFFNTADLRKLDGLLLLDSKVWKGARSLVRSIIMTIIGPREIKRQVALRFAKMYPKMIETFIMRDREPEHSICLMTVQLFSVPSIGQELVASREHNFLHKLLQMLQAIFTGHLSASGDLMLPPLPPAHGLASPESMLMRQQRCYHMFYDLRYIISADGVQNLLVEQPAHLHAFLSFLSLFNAITPDRRAVAAHVEFESEVWVPVFHVSTQLARAAKLLGEAFKRASPKQLQEALVTTASSILLNLLTLHQNSPDSYEPIKLRKQQFASVGTFEIIEFSVENQATSFHHPMHWLLAELLKHANGTFSGAALASLGTNAPATLGALFPSDLDERAWLNIVEFPLRVIVKLSQIRAGMWVRNGYAIRSQAHHYRENTMRDIMYDQDLFLLQAGLVLVPADRMLVSIIDRFGVLQWFQGGTKHGSLDADQVRFFVEDTLLLLITLLSETSAATSAPIEQQVRREIVHFLALSQGTYSELTKHISDRLTDHSSFDRVLAQVSTFRAPDGTNDLGIFELRDECYDEVQPFFYHYTRNQRERAEEVLRLRHKKRNAGSQEAADSFVAVPERRLAPGQGPFIDGLRAVFTSPVLLEALLYAMGIYMTDGEADQPDPYVDALLQLLMMGTLERGADFVRALVLPHESVEVTLPHLSLLGALCELENFVKFKPIKAKAKWIIEQALKLDPEAASTRVSGRHVPKAVEAGAPPSVEDAKRAAAKARQAAIMKQFSAQQASLLASLGDDDEDDEDEEDETMAGTNDTAAPSQRSLGSCILCQEELGSGRAFGSLALIQTSRVMRTTPRRQATFLQQVLDAPLTLDRNASNGRRVTEAYQSAQESSSNFFPSDDHRAGHFASTCGHIMHVDCFEAYCRSTEQRQTQQIARNHPENLSRSEFVCPLCKSLGNVILPLPDAAAMGPVVPVDMPLTEWMRKINIDILKTSANASPAELQELDFGTGSFIPWYVENALTNTHDQAAASARAGIDKATYKMLERLVQVLRPLSAKSRLEREIWQIRSILAPPGKRMYMPEELVAYTISMLEVSLRGTAPAATATSIPAASVSEGVNEQTSQMLRSLIYCLQSIVKVDHAGPAGLATMHQGLLKRLLPHWGNDDTVRAPLLLRDPLTILVETAVLAPTSLGQVTTLMYYASLIHAIFGLAQPSVWPQASGSVGRSAQGANGGGLRTPDFSAADVEMLRTVFPDVRWTVANVIGFVGYARGNITLGVDGLDDLSLAKMLCTYTLPFLRRAAILHRAVGSTLDVTPTRPGSEVSEYVRLLQALRIPPPGEALPVRAERQTAIASMVEGWIKHSYTALASLFRPLPIYPTPLSAVSGMAAHLHPTSTHPTLQLEQPTIYELVSLPHDLASLLQETQRRTCGRCGDVPPEPALCLMCGAALCFQCFCCQDEEMERGECNRHLDECGGSMGIYFRVKANVVVLLYAGNGSFTFSPYLDTHGELDIGLRKGRPQRLHPQRYDELRKQWLTHAVCHVVARKIEAAMDQGGWDTM